MRHRLLCGIVALAALLVGDGTRGHAAAVETPAQVAQAIATGCSERRYSDVGGYLHPTLRRTWIEIGYSVKEFCELITRNYTLAEVRIVKEERVGAHAVVFASYVYGDGAVNADRSVLLQEKGAWKLAN